MPTLRLAPARPTTAGHQGEVFTCAFSPDGAFVLSGGWDGELRLWGAEAGEPVTAFTAGPKPISACAISPSGKYWLSGSLEGQLTVWDAMTHRQVRTFLAHTRPVSAIQYAEEERTLATASWDRSLMIWDLEQERDGQMLTGHNDIVTGCRFTPDGRRLLSWSHDGTLRLWERKPLTPHPPLTGHADRVTAAAISPDSRWAVSGSRDGALILWDLEELRTAQSTALEAEVRACFFLLDGRTLVTIDAAGRVVLLRLPDLSPSVGLATRLPVLCAALDTAGSRIALGCGDGRVYFVEVDGFDEEPLVVTPTRSSRRTATTLQRLLGRSTVEQTYKCTCPVCRHSFETATASPGQPAPCPKCHRRLQLSNAMRAAPE